MVTKSLRNLTPNWSTGLNINPNRAGRGRGRFQGHLDPGLPRFVLKRGRPCERPNERANEHRTVHQQHTKTTREHTADDPATHGQQQNGQKTPAPAAALPRKLRDIDDSQSYPPPVTTRHSAGSLTLMATKSVAILTHDLVEHWVLRALCNSGVVSGSF
jgi:hypothetical protein